MTMLISLELQGIAFPVRFVADKIEHDFKAVRISRDGIETAQFVAADVLRWQIENVIVKGRLEAFAS
jgi:hypothetical protein